MIYYRPGKDNAGADALTRREDEVDSQNGVKAEYRTQTLLSKDRISSKVLQDLGYELSPIDLVLLEGKDNNKPVENLILVKKILNTNRISESLAALRI